VNLRLWDELKNLRIWDLRMNKKFASPALMSWHLIFRKLSQDGEWTNFSENFHPSLFNDDQSNETTVNHIILAGQNL
jgi:hypothetical protein